MRIGRTLPPAAAPLFLRDILSGLLGIGAGESEVQSLQQELKTYFNKKHCFLVSSGKAALTLILMALKKIHPDRHHVLIPAFACYSVPSAIVRAGLHVQLCDIDINTLDFDYDELEDKLKNPQLLCVVSLHLFGLPADVERLRNMISDPMVTIVEDAAQAMGGEWQGKKLGTQGDVGFFSLGRGKALTAVEGGIILTDDENLGKQLESQVDLLPESNIFKFINHFVYAFALVILLRPAFFWIPSAMPFLKLGETKYLPDFPLFKLSPFQAGLMRGIAEKLRIIKLERKKNIRSWVEFCSSLMIKCIGSQPVLPDLIRFPVHIRSNKTVESLLKQSAILGLGFAGTYPDAIDGIPEIKQYFIGQDFPKARQACQEILTLPVHCFLNDNDREQIIRLLADQGAIEGARS
jgi:perosamine synthetase